MKVVNLEAQRGMSHNLKEVPKSQPLFQGGAKAAVTFSIDDCLEDATVAVFELFKNFHTLGTFNVVAGFPGKKIGNLQFAGWSLLREIAENGNEVASHSMTHRTLSNSKIPHMAKVVNALRHENPFRLSRRIFSLLTQDNKMVGVEHLSFVEELQLSKKKIEEEIGALCSAYVYPGGGYDEPYKNLVKQSGYSSARSGHVGYNLPWATEIFSLKAQVWDSNVNAKVANSWVDKALSCNYWLIEVIHSVDRPNDIYSANMGDLKSHLQYVESKKIDLWVSTQTRITEFLTHTQEHEKYFGSQK